MGKAQNARARRRQSTHDRRANTLPPLCMAIGKTDQRRRSTCTCMSHNAVLFESAFAPVFICMHVCVRMCVGMFVCMCPHVRKGCVCVCVHVYSCVRVCMLFVFVLCVYAPVLFGTIHISSSPTETWSNATRFNRNKFERFGGQLY